MICMSDCKCWIEAGVETKMVSSDVYPNEGEWVVYRGFMERCAKCQSSLGDGYGDPDFYPTKEKADEAHEKDVKAIALGWTQAESNEIGGGI